jgi:predicted dehydrogenase
MHSSNTTSAAGDVTRRDFIRGGSFATLMAMLGGVELKSSAALKNAEGQELTGPKVKVGIIGLGVWGRDIIATLQRQPQAEIAAICDHYPAMVRRSEKNVPGVKAFEDYKALLAEADIPAVIVATPTHQHRAIVEAALAAGKHVYCEAPLAHTVEDARAIAVAAKQASTQVFQSGLAYRADPQRHFLLGFIRSGAVGKVAVARAQWHKKTSWRSASPNADREKEINWRLDKSLSLGLLGEIGIHQIDAVSWFLQAEPVAVTSYGGLIRWQDGRTVPDTAQTVIEYPGGVQFIYEATLVNSFDTDYEIIHGDYAAVMMRGNKAWLFKEVDSPLLGWEVYAKKDIFHKETGIALVANATKLATYTGGDVEDPPFVNTPLAHSLEAFLSNVGEVAGAVADYIDAYGAADKKGLEKTLAGVPRLPTAGWKEGYQATVLAIKANESLLAGKRVVLQKDWFEVT